MAAIEEQFKEINLIWKLPDITPVVATPEEIKKAIGVGGFVKVNKRLDLQGKQLAFLEDLPAMLFA